MPLAEVPCAQIYPQKLFATHTDPGHFIHERAYASFLRTANFPFKINMLAA
jgi:hypothetical protein